MYTIESISLGASCLCFGLYPSFSKQCVAKRALVFYHPVQQTVPLG